MTGSRQEFRLGAIGVVGGLAGGEVLAIGLFEPFQGLRKLRRALLDEEFALDRGLKQAIGPGLAVDDLLHPAQQSEVDPFQAANLFAVRRVQGAGLVDRTERSQNDGPVHRTAHAESSAPLEVERPKAMPVRVWLRCIDIYCSP